MINAFKIGYERYHVITDQTDKEWPKDHPLRKGALIVSREAARQLGDVLICQLVGEERIPPPEGDKDVKSKCCACQRRVIHRKSAPALPKMCWECWTRGAWPLDLTVQRSRSNDNNRRVRRPKGSRSDPA